MPLLKSKSKKAFEHNIKAEMNAGKPQKQALAIAYSMKRAAHKAKGGPIHANEHGQESKMEKAHDAACPAHHGGMCMCEGGMYAKGGMANEQGHESHMEMEHEAPGYGDSLIDKIMKKRKMAEGGMVDIDENGEEESANPNEYDKLNEMAADHDDYFDDSQLSEQPHDSNLKGDELEDEDAHDMVGRIRKKMKSKA